MFARLVYFNKSTSRVKQGIALHKGYKRWGKADFMKKKGETILFQLMSELSPPGCDIENTALSNRHV